MIVNGFYGPYVANQIGVHLSLNYVVAQKQPKLITFSINHSRKIDITGVGINLKAIKIAIELADCAPVEVVFTQCHQLFDEDVVFWQLQQRI
jgi:hypothetical protein